AALQRPATMKAVLDTMLWVSYCTRRDGFRHRLIDRALNARARRIRSFVPGDPRDAAAVQTAIPSKSDYLLTAAPMLLDLGKVQIVEIISVKVFAQRLPAPG